MSLYLCYISETITIVKVEDNPSKIYFQVRIVNVCVEFGFFFLQNLKFNIQKTKIMQSGPNTSWQIDGETVETVADFIFWGSKITADEDCSHEIKRRLLLGRKVMTNLDSILEKAMAPHSSTLARKIPWMEEPGGLQSMGSLRVRHY